MRINKGISVLFPLSLALITLSSCNGSINFKEKIVKNYLGSISFAKDQKLYFSSSLPGIPYIDLKDSVEFLKDIHLIDPKYDVKGKEDGYSYILERDNGAKITFNFKYNTIESNNPNLFKANSFSITSFDGRSIDDCFYDEQGKAIKDQVRFNGIKDYRQTYDTKPTSIFMLLDDYNINIYKQGSKYLVPFTTFYNIAGAPNFTSLFNGENLFLTTQSLYAFGEDYYNKFYSFKKQTRSKELREYNYYELCRDLDYVYGLSKEHGISSFTKFMEENGLKDLLLSESRYDEDKAYYKLQYSYLSDFHSGFTIPNAYGGVDPKESKIPSEIAINPTYIQRELNKINMAVNRAYYKAINPNTGAVLSPIVQTGDTLILSFDSFVVQQDDVDFYYKDEFKNNKKTYLDKNLYDTVALISYANDIIHEDAKTNKKIKNVVIDLSGNGGGMSDAAIFTLGWLDSALMQFVDPISEYQGSLSYYSDINFDKKIDGDDLLVFSNAVDKSKYIASGGVPFEGNVYCLTSNLSFSCANYVPAMLKQTGLAKLIGSKTGGGACIVHVTGTADGSGISFSGNKKLCQVINGSYYSIDQGIEPDYPLNDFETLYGGDQQEGESSNRKYLVDYIDKLR